MIFFCIYIYNHINQFELKVGDNMGLSSLNINNPMVTIMEHEFEEVRKRLMNYTRLHIQSLIIINICNVVICLCIFGNIPLLITSEIILNIFMKNTIENIHRECNLKQVGKILFNDDDYDIYDINEADVYNTTRLLSEMKGKVDQSIKILKYFDRLCIIFASISLIWTMVIIILQLIVFR